MEQSEGYKEVQEIIKTLEKRLAICTNINEICDKKAQEVHEEIEEHFAKCFNALAARKEELLREVTQEIANHKKRVDNTRAQVVSSIEACNKGLQSASLLYPINASSSEHILKGLQEIPIANVFDAHITADLPNSILQSIQCHGKVDMFRRFSVADSVTTFAGGSDSVDVSALNARFYGPYGICVNPHDNCLYVCEWNNHTIRKITMQGGVSTFKKELSRPSGIAMNIAEKTFFVTNCSGHSISKITASGIVTPFAGSGQIGNADGVGVNATFNFPRNITIDQATGNLFICEVGSHLIRKITPQGEVSTLAGSSKGYTNGCGKTAQFYVPCGIFFDASSQSLIVCDKYNKKLRRIMLNGEVSTLLQLDFIPLSVTMTENKTILVCSDYQVFRVNLQEQKCVVLAGVGTEGRKDGCAELAGFRSLSGIAVHEPSHTCFVTDHYNIQYERFHL